MNINLDMVLVIPMNISTCVVTQRLELFENLEKVDHNFLDLSAKNEAYVL